MKITYRINVKSLAQFLTSAESLIAVACGGTGGSGGDGNRDGKTGPSPVGSRWSSEDEEELVAAAATETVAVAVASESSLQVVRRKCSRGRVAEVLGCLGGGRGGGGGGGGGMVPLYG